MFFRLYEKNIFGYLNLLGLAFFSMIVITSVFILRNQLEQNQKNLMICMAVYFFATANINKAIFPYGNSKPITLFLQPRTLLVHVFNASLRLYSLQLLVAVIFLFFPILTNQINELSVLILICMIILNLFSPILTGILMLLFKIIIPLTMWGLYREDWWITFFCIVFSFGLIGIVPFSKINVSIFSNFLIRSSNLKTKYLRQRLTVLGEMISRNVGGIFLITAIFTMLNFFSVPYIKKLHDIPILMFYQTVYATILEILVGNSINEIVIDRAKIKLFANNNQVSQLNKFMVTSIFYISSILFLTEAVSLIGLVVSSNTNIYTTIKNLVLLPFTFFIGFCYYRKAELLIMGEKNKVMKLSLPIIYIIITTIATVMVMN